MNDNKVCKSNQKLPGVVCEVTQCVYHGQGNGCYADRIKVEDPTADSKSDTFCATFVNQLSSRNSTM